MTAPDVPRSIYDRWADSGPVEVVRPPILADLVGDSAPQVLESCADDIPTPPVADEGQ